MARPTKNDALRGQLVAAATAIVVERGPAAVSAREIASACAVSPGTIYNYFENVEAIIREVRLEVQRQLAAALAPGDAISVPERLNAVAHAYVTFAASRRELWTLVLQADTSALAAGDPEPLTMLKGSIGAALIAEGEAPEAEDMARCLAAAVHALAAIATSQKHASVQGQEPDELVGTLIATMIKGMAQRRRPARRRAPARRVKP